MTYKLKTEVLLEVQFHGELSRIRKFERSTIIYIHHQLLKPKIAIWECKKKKTYHTMLLIKVHHIRTQVS